MIAGQLPATRYRRASPRLSMLLTHNDVRSWYSSAASRPAPSATLSAARWACSPGRAWTAVGQRREETWMAAACTKTRTLCLVLRSPECGSSKPATHLVNCTEYSPGPGVSPEGLFRAAEQSGGVRVQVLHSLQPASQEVGMRKACKRKNR